MGRKQSKVANKFNSSLNTQHQNGKRIPISTVTKECNGKADRKTGNLVNGKEYNLDPQFTNTSQIPEKICSISLVNKSESLKSLDKTEVEPEPPTVLTSTDIDRMEEQLETKEAANNRSLGSSSEVSTVSSCETDTESIGSSFDTDNEEALLELWDPMAETYHSVANLNSKDVPFAVQGLTNFKGTLCPHANKTGRCYKGSRCPYEHHIDQAKFSVNPKLKEKLLKEDIKITHYNDLPERPLGPGDSSFIGTFSHVESPQEFYVIPKYSIRCLCTEEFLKGAEIVNPLTAMFHEMRKYYKKHDFRNEVSFGIQQLAAVRSKIGRVTKYYRAAVVGEPAVIETDDVPQVTCCFIDLGYTERVALSNLSKLPKFFCKKPPLAYKCGLYGISPIYRRFSAPVQDRLLELVTDMEALITIRRPYYPSEDGVAFMDPVPYLVELHVNPTKGLNVNFSKLIDVREELVKTGQAVSWNANIYRPHPWTSITYGEIDITVNKDVKSSFKGKLSAEVVEREREYYKVMLSEITQGMKDTLATSASSPPTPIMSTSPTSIPAMASVPTSSSNLASLSFVTAIGTPPASD